MYVHTASLKGRRPDNEDCHYKFINIDNRENNSSLAKINVYGIFDGHGGKQVSSYVSSNLPKRLIKKDIKYPLSKNYVYQVYDNIQSDLKKSGFAYNMGSTGLVVAQYMNKGAQYLNVINNGDSRCVLCRGNFAMPLTIDHKPSWPQEKQRIEQLGGKITYDGYDWRIKDLSVSRAFGDLDASPYVTHRPNLYNYELNKDDKFFIIACDGLWDVLDNQSAVNFVLSNYKSDKKVNVARLLAEYAIKKKSGDNVSCIIVFLK